MKRLTGPHTRVATRLDPPADEGRIDPGWWSWSGAHGGLSVALLTGAQYEYHQHAPDFLAAGGTQAELDALGAYCRGVGDPALSGLGETESLVVRYAAQMTRDVKVDGALFRQLQGKFDTTELVELTAAIATYNMVARFLVALGVTPEE